MKYPSNRKPRSTAVNVAAAKKAARSKKLAKAARSSLVDFARGVIGAEPPSYQKEFLQALEDDPAGTIAAARRLGRRPPQNVPAVPAQSPPGPVPGKK